MASPDGCELIKNHSPSEFPGHSHVIYESINLKGNLSLYDIRETLVALAQNHYLTIQYIINNYGPNIADAIAELNDARIMGKRIFVCESNPHASTMDVFWKINPDLAEEELRKYIRPNISKGYRPKIKSATSVTRAPKKWTSKKQRPQPKDPRWQSNRIANHRPKTTYRTVTGGGAPKVGPESKSNTGWNNGVSLQFGKDIKAGNLISNDE